MNFNNREATSFHRTIHGGVLVDLSRRRDSFLFLLLGGIVAFLLSVALSSIFVVALPMSEDWCLKSERIQTGPDRFETVCVAFKNSFEEAKYHHNSRMIARNKVLLGIEFALWLGVTGLLFHWIPKWKGHVPVTEGANRAFRILLLAFCVSMVVPLVVSWLLPPPVDWFPSVFAEIRDAQVERALREIRRR